MSENKFKGWKIREVIGEAVINPLVLLPEEERRVILAEKELELKQLWEIGEPVKEGLLYVCPNGCKGEFRTHGARTTLLGWFGGPAEDPNHHTEDCSCQTCGARFTKHWVPAKNGGKPWFIVGDTWEERRVYNGECQCCCPKEE